MYDPLIRIFNYAACISFAVAVAAIIFFAVGSLVQFVGQRPNRKKSLSVRSVSILLLPISAVFIFEGAIGTIARHKMNSILSVPAASRIVLVNGVRTSDPNRVVAALKGVHFTLGHHSHPTRRITVELKTEADTITLTLGRDSEVDQEYWVFYPALPFTWGHELGRINTQVFDGY